MLSEFWVPGSLLENGGVRPGYWSFHRALSFMPCWCRLEEGQNLLDLLSWFFNARIYADAVVRASGKPKAGELA